MKPTASISIDALQLDLRGLQHDIARTVPQLIGPALRQQLAASPVHPPVRVDRIPDLRVAVPPNASAQDVARQIARQIAANLAPRTQHPEAKT